MSNRNQRRVAAKSEKKQEKTGNAVEQNTNATDDVMYRLLDDLDKNTSLLLLHAMVAKSVNHTSVV